MRSGEALLTRKDAMFIDVKFRKSVKITIDMGHEEYETLLKDNPSFYGFGEYSLDRVMREACKARDDDGQAADATLQVYAMGLRVLKAVMYAESE